MKKRKWGGEKDKERELQENEEITESRKKGKQETKKL